MKRKVTEKWVKSQIVKTLKQFEAYYFFPVASGYMTIGVPDIIVCYQGKFIGIECKANGNTPTVLQSKNLKAIQTASGYAMVVDETDINAVSLLLNQIKLMD